MILLPEWLHMLNYVKTFFPYPSTPPLSNLLKSTCSTCSAFKIFQNIQNCNRHQSAPDFFLSGFHLWFLAFCTNMREEFVVRFPLAPHQFENKWTTKHWSYNTIWPTYFLACFGYGVWWNEFCYMMLYVVPLSQKMISFNAGAIRVDFSIHPHGNPRHSWKKNGTLLLLSPVKNEHFRSMFVTCAFPGL